MYPRGGFPALVCYGAVLTKPLFTYQYYHWMLHHDAYLPGADSIAIPIFSEFVLWCIWAPLSYRGLSAIFKRCAPPFRLFAWDCKRPLKSTAVTVACLAMVVLVAGEIPHAIEWRNNSDAVGCFWWIFFWLIVRSAWLSRATASALPEAADYSPPNLAASMLEKSSATPDAAGRP